MGFLINRVSVMRTYIAERMRLGVPEQTGPLDREVIFLLDGVGGLQAGPLMVRRALRLAGLDIGTIIYDWQCCLRGEIWTDLMWHARNRRMGAMLARRLLRFRREHPSATIHLVAFSGGSGIAVFACESLRARKVVDTMVLACPALSPTYDLSRALRGVHRCYALISRRDRGILGWGTRVFGTIDRRFTSAAGQVGFRIPANASDDDRHVYDRLQEVCWSPELCATGHHGGHTGWGSVEFVRRYLPGLLRGAPELVVRTVESRTAAPTIG